MVRLAFGAWSAVNPRRSVAARRIGRISGRHRATHFFRGVHEAGIGPIIRRKHPVTDIGLVHQGWIARSFFLRTQPGHALAVTFGLAFAVGQLPVSRLPVGRLPV